MSFVFRVWEIFVKTDDNLVLFVSFMGKSFNDSLKVIYDYIQSNDQLKNINCVWAFENPEEFRDLNTVTIDSPAYFKTTNKK